jgi:hypothetical protein
VKSKRPKRHPVAPAKPQRPGLIELAGPAIAGSLAYIMICGFTSFASPLVAGLLAGAFVGLSIATKREALIAGALAGFVGGLVSGVVFAEEVVVSFMNRMPPYANPDVSRALYVDALLPLLRGNWVNSAGLGGSAPWVLCLVAAVVVGGVAYGVSMFGSRTLGGVPARKLGAWVAIALLVLTFIDTASVAGATFKSGISQEPADNSYAYDGYIGLRAYYEMGKGQAYYPAMVRAAAGDARLIKDNAVVDGKFRSWAFSPSFIKMPYTFYLWRLVAPGGGGGIFSFSVFVCGAILALSYWALSAYLDERAVLVPIVLFPVLLLGTVWANMTMTEWWAGLAGLIALLLMARRQLVAAAVVALAAALFREVMAIELVLFLVVAVWAWARGRGTGWRRAALVNAALLVVFFAAYALHYRSGIPYIAAADSGVTPLTMLQNSAVRPLDAKFLAPASYMMFSYGYFVLPGWTLLIAGLTGLAWTLRTDREAMLVCAGFVAFWLAFSFTIGATSSYWGQFYMPFAMVGTAALLADLGGFLKAGAEKARSLFRRG